MCDHHPHPVLSAVEADVSRRAFLRMLGIGTVTAGASTLLAVPRVEARAATAPADPTAAWSWFMTDPHVHSCISGDGQVDVGIISSAAKALGYHAMFLTDHQAANTGNIAAVVANHVVLDDSLGTKWLPFSGGTTSQTTTAMASSPVKSGTASLRLATTSSSSGEAGVCLQRGPTLTATGATMTFWVNPARLDPGCGFAVSCSVGGDPRIEPPEGFTTTDNMARPGRSVVLVWQSAPFFTASTDPNRRVVVNSLKAGPVGTWTPYTIDVRAALATLPAAEQPLDYNAFNQVALSVLAQRGSADVYVDAFHFDAVGENTAGQDFVYRNTRIRDFDTATYRVFPSIELGISRHVQRFDFDITQASDMPSYSQGTQGIGPTQQLGIPVQLNHPGLPGGATATDTIDNLAYNADWVECCPRSGSERVMMDIWDAVLTRSHILGSWTSDMHKTSGLSSSTHGYATYVLAEALDFDPLIRSFWEGRCYLATNSFPGRVLLTTGALQTPYPARHPLWVSTASPTADVRVRIDTGLTTGHSITWVVDGAVTSTDHPGGTSYDATRRLTVTGSRSYVRAAVQDASGAFVAMTEPVLVLPVSGLPSGQSVSVERVLTADGKHYNRVECLGITSVGGDSASTLIALTHPAHALVDLAVRRPTAPATVRVAGTVVPSVSSRTALQASTTSCWTYDGTAGLLTVRVDHGASTSVQVALASSTGDVQAPTVPTGLTATADATVPSVALAWKASVDDVGVRGYQVRRDGTYLAEVAGLTYTDSALQPATSYSWTVEAVDTSGNLSPLSAPATATTAAAPTRFSFVCAGDTYTDAGTGKAYPTATKLRLDASPVVTSYLRFDLAGLPAQVSRATLRLRLTSACAQLRVSSTSAAWTETGLTLANAPGPGTALAVATQGATGDWLALDVTAGVDGNGAVAFAVTTDSGTAATFSSREGTDPPVLVVDTGAGAADGTPPSVPGTLTAAADPSLPAVRLSWGASTDDVAVRGYQVLRGGALVTEVSGTTYTDAALQPATTYTWAVRAVDTSGNLSGLSNAATATTAASAGPASTTVVCAADTYADSSTGKAYPTATKLRVDASPVVRSYLRFDVPALPGGVTRATLKVRLGSSCPQLQVSATSTGWTEAGLTPANAPAAGPVLSAVTAAASGTWVQLDVTQAVAGSGAVAFVLATTSGTATSLSSREGTDPPVLVVETA